MAGGAPKKDARWQLVHATHTEQAEIDAIARSGAAAAGFKQWGLQTGARADMVVLNMSTPGLLGIPHTHTLDALVFACNHAAIDEVYVAGKRRVSGGLHREQSMIAENFKSTMLELLR